MSIDIHSKTFTEGTQLKLDVFRRYIREWVSVFMTDSPKLIHLAQINIFDFFSGPGVDGSGNPGSPLIIIDEIKKYCKSRGVLKSNKKIQMYFNDFNKEKIKTLRIEVPKVSCNQNCCKVEVTSKPFDVIFEEYLPLMRNGKSANLVIMDQFGISDVTPEVIQRLADCASTDVLFFIPSSHIHRFQKHPAFANKIDLGAHNLDHFTIHRHVCDYFREKISDRKYYLAPFSIKDGRKIHGIIFGSGKLYGLEKFLNVCWAIDSTTGEANYPVDKDPAWSGEEFLFEEMNTIRKIDLFKYDLKAFIEKEEPDNLQMYQFILTKGFTPKKAAESLTQLQHDNWLKVDSLIGGEKARKGTFYLNHTEKTARIRFMKGPGAV